MDICNDLVKELEHTRLNGSKRAARAPRRAKPEDWSFVSRHENDGNSATYIIQIKASLIIFDRVQEYISHSDGEGEDVEGKGG